eukprot:15464154-Alexandrium_andersonii.AAC.1
MGLFAAARRGATTSACGRASSAPPLLWEPVRRMTGGERQEEPAQRGGVSMFDSEGATLGLPMLHWPRRTTAGTRRKRKLQPALRVNFAKSSASATMTACVAAAILSQRGSTRRQDHGALCARPTGAAASVR